jgi:hypothetical protein
MKFFFNILFLYTITNISIFAQFAVGDGSANNQFQIKTIKDIKTLADSINKGWTQPKHLYNFKLMNDITEPVTSVIGDDHIDTNHNFRGVFDGNNHFINLDINYPNTVCVGLFATTYNCIIKNLSVKGSVIGRGSVRGIVGGSAENCFTDALACSYYIGGNNYANVSITPLYNNTGGGGLGFGGICGSGFNIVVYNCINTGYICMGTTCSGGIIGNTDGSEIQNCINTEVICIDDNMQSKSGGIIGSKTKTNTDFRNCFYDKQFCIFRNFNNTSGIINKLTTDMLGMKLVSYLGDEDWIYTDSLYPQLKAFAGTDVSKIAASPAYLNNDNIDDYDEHNNIRKCFYVNTENNIIWTGTLGKVEFSDNGKVYLENLENDTMYAGIGNTIPVNINELCQKTEDTTLTDTNYYSNAQFRIIASENILISPTSKNYKIPIYITANMDIIDTINISKLVIKELIFTINRQVFNPKKTDNGNIFYLYSDDTLNIKIENIQIPNLKKGEKHLLLNIIGDVILGNIDSSDINLISVTIVYFNNILVEPELIDGCLTTKICDEGEDRLLNVISIAPGIFVLNNPVNSNILELKCICYERGSYYIEIFDIAGNALAVKEWEVNPNLTNEYLFNIELPYYIGIGNYYLVMHSPTTNYYNSFVKIGN